MLRVRDVPQHGTPLHAHQIHTQTVVRHPPGTHHREHPTRMRREAGLRRGMRIRGRRIRTLRVLLQVQGGGVARRLRRLRVHRHGGVQHPAGMRPAGEAVLPRDGARRREQDGEMVVQLG